MMYAPINTARWPDWYTFGNPVLRTNLEPRNTPSKVSNRSSVHTWNVLFAPTATTPAPAMGVLCAPRVVLGYVRGASRVPRVLPVGSQIHSTGNLCH